MSSWRFAQLIVIDDVKRQRNSTFILFSVVVCIHKLTGAFVVFFCKPPLNLIAPNLVSLYLCLPHNTIAEKTTTIGYIG